MPVLDLLFSDDDAVRAEQRAAERHARKHAQAAGDFERAIAYESEVRAARRWRAIGWLLAGPALAAVVWAAFSLAVWLVTLVIG